MFAGACLLLHWLYSLYSGAAFLGVWMSVRLGGSGATRAGDGR